MGQLLFFEPRRTVRSSGGRNLSAGASVIIFPGVRYERLPDVDLTPAPKSRTKLASQSKAHRSRH